MAQVLSPQRTIGRLVKLKTVFTKTLFSLFLKGFCPADGSSTTAGRANGGLSAFRARVPE